MTQGRGPSLLLVVAALAGLVGLIARGGLPGPSCDPSIDQRCGAADATEAPASTAFPGGTPLVLPTSPDASADASTAPSAAPTEPPTFADAFDGTKIGPEWSRSWERIGSTSWSKSQATVQDGILTIQAERRGSEWFSWEMDTVDSFQQAFGHFAARVKAPAGTGLWPTFWIAEGWRTSRHEIDIMEICANAPGTHDGNDRTILHNFIHDEVGTHVAEQHLTVENATDTWHVYELDWRRDHVTVTVDGVPVWSVTDRKVIPTTPMSVVLDLATGGWCGDPDDSTPNPSEMQVDWVRVWK